MGGCNENPCKGNKTDAKNFIAFVALRTLRTKPESRRELIFQEVKISSFLLFDYLSIVIANPI